MGITAEQLVVGGIVAGALLFLVRRMVRSFRAARATAAGCASDCGCSAPGRDEARRG